MTTSPTSGSERRARSSSFALLAEPVRRWIWRKNWSSLRDIQERSIPLLAQEENDVVIAAATAGGKTEAAFLPLISRVIESNSEGRGFDLLYISPLRALINDQFRRLEDLCETVDLPVHPWHGDISAAVKSKARKNPRGILLITPESLEATFVLRGLEVPGLFGRLGCIVIDELHAFLGTERGIQLLSLLGRLEFATRRRIRRVGLSATLGDMNLVRQYLRPEAPQAVTVLQSDSEGPVLRLQLRGYRIPKPESGVRKDKKSTEDQESSISTQRAIATHLFDKLRGTTNLVFAGSRQDVELFSDLLRRISEQRHLPNEFYPHHASLSREHRAFLEGRLKAARLPTTAVCTSTLELGIDIGDVECVAQIGTPFSVASLRQRLGRSGRRAGQPAVLRMYSVEQDIDANTRPVDTLRLDLVQSIAMVELLLEGWCEPPQPAALHLSTLVHQVLSVVAERNGIKAKRLFSVLCEHGPFKQMDTDLFARLLRQIGTPEVGLIEQSRDGTLLLGREGERIVEHYGFYAVFQTPEEYRILFNGRSLGTIPIHNPLAPGMSIIFSGRRWRIRSIHDRDKVIEVERDATGRSPHFGGDGGGIIIDDTVVRRMRTILEGDEIPRYLDREAADLLSEGRRSYRRLGLASSRIVGLGGGHYLIATWSGTIRTTSFALILRSHGFIVDVHDGFLDVGPEHETEIDLPDILKKLATDPAPSGKHLVSNVVIPQSEKYHQYLSDDLLVEDALSGRLLPDAVPEMAADILEESQHLNEP